MSDNDIDNNLETDVDARFNDWFNKYLLHKTAPCLDRDILRWAKPVLKEGFLQQEVLTEGNDHLEWKGAQVYVDAYKEKANG